MSQRIPTSEPSESSSSPRVNPLWQRQRRPFHFTFVSYSILLPLFVILLVVALVTQQDRGLVLFLSVYLVMFSLLFTLFIFLYRFQGGYWRRAEQRRTLAVQGDPAFLAADQPPPNDSALPLPITIELTATRRFIQLLLLGWVVGIVGGVILGGVLISQLSTIGHHRPLTAGAVALIFGVPIIIFLIVMLVTLWLIVRRVRQSLTVTEHGLTGRLLGRVSTVEWAGANAFAMIGVKKARRSTLFELSGPQGAVHWTRPAQQPLWFMDFLGPKDARADYQQQMDALLSVIAAKTGLPLYDLRETSQKWYY